MTLLAAASIWWTTILLLRSTGSAPPPFVLAPGATHALIMGGAFMPMFFVGFLCTAGVRWLRLPPVGAASLLPLAGAWWVGWPLFAAGAQLDTRMAATGLALVALFWSNFVVRLARMVSTSTADDRLHSGIIAGACAMGAASFWYGAWALAAAEPARLALAESMLLDWFLAPVFVAALHRMVPFLHIAFPTLEQRFDDTTLWLAVGALALHPFVQLLTLASGDAAFARTVQALAFLVYASMAAVIAWIAWRWKARQNLGIRLLTMLFAGLVWLGITFALRAADALVLALGHSVAQLQLAALHTLSMGFFASTMLAMVSRVTCGQAGRMLSFERIVWRLFLALQAATVLRIAAAALPTHPLPLIASVLVWSTAMLIWSLRYAGWYGRPRFDGRPG